jgi:Family of unknown function (DUF5678)
MVAGEGKTLFLRNLPTALVREAKAMAAHRGETLTMIVAEALTRALEAGDASAGRGGRAGGAPGNDELDRDIAWYRAHRASLLRRYRGEYVAIVDAAVVDHGREFGALAARVFARYGDRSIYMPRVQPDQPTVRIRSPRRSPR